MNMSETDKSPVQNPGHVIQTDISGPLSSQSTPITKRTGSFLHLMTSWRLRVAFQMHYFEIVNYVLAMNMPIALVCMLKTPSRDNYISETGTTSFSSLQEGTMTTGRNKTEDSTVAQNVEQTGGEFQWESSVQGLLLTSGTMLNFFMPLMTDYLGRVIGSKRLLLVCLAGSAILTLLHPVGARLSPYALIALRIGVSLLGGTSMPLTSEVLSWWVPENEKVSMAWFVFSGPILSMVLVAVTSAYICTISIDNGWPFIFYIHGGITLVLCLIWQLFGSIRPEDHSFISEKEKRYIKETRHGMDNSQKPCRPPYMMILKSAPVWGFLVVMTVHMYSTLILTSFLPIYFTTMLHFSIEEAGVLISVGYAVRFLAVILWGQLSNLITAKTTLGKTACRKIVQCSGYYLCTLGLLTLGFVGDKILAICITFLVMLCQSSALASGFILPLDMAPRFASFLTGCFITIATLLSMAGPVITSLVIESGTAEAWRNVFIGIAVAFFTGATAFLLLGSSDLQILPGLELASSSISGETVIGDMTLPPAIQLNSIHSVSTENGNERFDFSKKQEAKKTDFKQRGKSNNSDPIDFSNYFSSFALAKSLPFAVLDDTFRTKPTDPGAVQTRKRLTRDRKQTCPTSPATAQSSATSECVSFPNMTADFNYTNPGFQNDANVIVEHQTREKYSPAIVQQNSSQIVSTIKDEQVSYCAGEETVDIIPVNAKITSSTSTTKKENPISLQNFFSRKDSNGKVEDNEKRTISEQTRL